MPGREEAQGFADGADAEPHGAGDLADECVLPVPAAEVDEKAAGRCRDDVRAAEHMFQYANDGLLNLPKIWMVSSGARGESQAAPENRWQVSKPGRAARMMMHGESPVWTGLRA